MLKRPSIVKTDLTDSEDSNQSLEGVLENKLIGLLKRQGTIEDEKTKSTNTSIKKVFGGLIDEFVYENVQKGRKFVRTSNSAESEVAAVPVMPELVNSLSK